MNKQLTYEIVKGFRNTGLTVTFGDGWINVMRPDGVHCEFNTCYPEDHSEDVLTSTYSLDDGKPIEIDLHVPSQIGEFVSMCQKILTFEKA